MRLQGTKSLGAPRAAVWEVLNDPRRMAKTMPGVESLDVIDQRRWRANVKIPLGLGGLRMALDMEQTEAREPEHAVMRIKGNGVGAMLNMTTSFTLEDAQATTDMHWDADIRIAGPVGAMGQRVLQPIINQQVASVLAALDREVQGGDVGDQELRGANEPSEPVEGPMHGGAGEGAGEAGGGLGVGETDPELKDSGPPAEGVGDPEGTSGAEEGISPWHPEGYSEEPEGPTQAAGDDGGARGAS